MKVREFVKETIIEIIQGVNDANDHLIETKQPGRAEPASTLEPVTFDIAVTVESENQGEGKGNLSVVGIGFGGKVQSTASEATVSRVQFKVPLSLPRAKDSKHSLNRAF